MTKRNARVGVTVVILGFIFYVGFCTRSFFLSPARIKKSLLPDGLSQMAISNALEESNLLDPEPFHLERAISLIGNPRESSPHRIDVILQNKDTIIIGRVDGQMLVGTPLVFESIDGSWKWQTEGSRERGIGENGTVISEMSE